MLSCSSPTSIRDGGLGLPVMCRFSAAGMTVSPRTPMAGGRKAPRHEIAGWERRWCRNYGDFAAGSGVDVVEGGGNVHNGRGPLQRYNYPRNRLPASPLLLPRSGLSRSDLVVCWACSVAWR
jgi:hypothetical protein